jgi:hypothetical protein
VIVGGAGVGIEIVVGVVVVGYDNSSISSLRRLLRDGGDLK